MKMDEIKAVLELLEDTDIREFEYEDENLRLGIKRGAASAPVVTAMAPAPMAAPAAALGTGTAAETVSGHVIPSPFVGTFYRAASPESAPYTEVGQRVEAGQTLCIVEAMKLMNEIEADVAGEVKEWLLDDGQPVNPGTPLMVIG